MTVTFKTTEDPDNVLIADRFGRFGSLWRIGEESIVENATEDDITAEDVGWHFDLNAPRLTTRSGGPFDTLPEAIQAVQEFYDDFAVDRAQEQTFDYRQGKRVVSIPSGGQSR
jgi:hypothetical protein